MKSYKEFIRESIKESIKESIESICEKYDITNYIINSDGSIDVDGNVDLDKLELFRIPLKFRNVTENFNCSGGYFNCFNNKLTTLEGAPQTVGGDFYCNDNKLTTLKGSPKSVGGNFECSGNQLTSLEYGPESVGGNFDCHSNQLTSLEGLPEIGGYINCRRNQIIDFRGVPEFFEGYFYCEGNPIEEIYTLFLQEDSINDSKCIQWINEFDVIRGNKVIMDRLEEVFHQLGMDIPQSVVNIGLKNLTFKNYEII